MNKARKILVFVAVIVVLAALLVVDFAVNHAQQGKKVPETPKITASIRIANVGEYSIFNLIAAKQDYFAQKGLRTTITEYPSGPPAVADLVAGKADFAVAADFVGVGNIVAGQKLRILAEVSSQDSFHILARKDKGITEPADLKGKRIGVIKKTAGEFFLGRFLVLHGMSTSDITEVAMTPADIDTQLANGQIDAAVTFEPHVYNLQKTLGNEAVNWSAQGNERTRALLYTTEDYATAHPDVVNRYVAALLSAENYLQQDDQGARTILASSMHYDPAYVNYLWPKITFSLSLDQDMLLAMEDEARFLNPSAGQQAIPNFLKYIDFTPMEQQKADAVTIIH